MASLAVSDGAMPRLLKYDWHPESDTLAHPEQLVDWVASRAKGPVNILLGDAYYQLLMVDVPDVPANEVEPALRLQAAELINYDIDDATIEIILLPSDAYRGRLRMAFVIAAAKSGLRDWALALARRGLKPVRIDIDQLQMRNLAIQAQQRHQTGLLQMGRDRCRLFLLYESELVLTRQFDIGYQDLGRDRVDDGSLTLEDQTDIQLDSLVLELRRSFDYYESQLGLGTVNNLNLLGWPGDASLATTLGDKLGARFSLLMPEDLLMLSANVDASVPEELMPLLGTAFGESRP